MTAKELLGHHMSDKISEMRILQQPFAIATIIKTRGVTAAKPGARAMLNSKGEIKSGWIGGGCISNALRNAVLTAIKEEKPNMISVAPENVLAEKGVMAGQKHDGIQFAKNTCPSEATIDIFIEPILPEPLLVVIGDSPTAEALKSFALQLDWHVKTGSELHGLKNQFVKVIIATQGRGDLSALEKTLKFCPSFVGFIGSKKKYAKLKSRLREKGFCEAAINSVEVPVGLDIGAVTPHEIALSILAKLTQNIRKMKVGT